MSSRGIEGVVVGGIYVPLLGLLLVFCYTIQRTIFLKKEIIFLFLFFLSSILLLHLSSASALLLSVRNDLSPPPPEKMGVVGPRATSFPFLSLRFSNVQYTWCVNRERERHDRKKGGYTKKLLLIELFRSPVIHIARILV